jgi:hypothetical protein
VIRIALVVAIVAGCSLLGPKAPPLELRYFAPDAANAARAAAPTQIPRAALRLGRISAAADLRYAIVHRDSAVEVTPYNTLRWTETPDAYLRRGVARALFEARPFAQAVGGDAPALDVELVGFEEVRRAAGCSGRVELRYELHDDRAVIARGTIAIEQPSRSRRIEDVVTAIGAALHAAVGELADRVSVALA